MSNDLTAADPRLAQFLLGLLPQDEAERLEEASIIDDEVAAALSSVENDLVDAYTMGVLDAERHQQFEAHYLKSPRRREKVRFARRFLAAVDRASIRPHDAAGDLTKSGRIAIMPARQGAVPRAVSRRGFNWAWVSTAASLAVACGLFVNDLQLRRGASTVERETASQTAHAEALARQLAQARAESARAAQLLAERSSAGRGEQSGTPTVAPDVADASQAAVLFPQTRAAAQVATLAISSSSRVAAFELRLESDDYEQYRATLYDSATGRIVWRSAVVKSVRAGQPRGSHDIATVPVIVPSRVLKSQLYTFELIGLERTGREIAVGSYGFEIE